jgi:MFS family permease
MTLPLDRHWKNLGWIFAVEAFWGVGLALTSYIAILPVLLAQLGASNAVIGSLSVIFILANGIPGVFAAHFTGRLAYRRRFVIWCHALTAIPWLLIGAWFLFVPRPAPWVDIAVLVGGWGIAWFWMGFFIPVWINFISKVTRPELRARSFGGIFFFQTLMGVAGGWVASIVLGSGMSFPVNYGLGFAIAGVVTAVGSFFFAPVVEEPGAISEREDPLRGIERTTREILNDRGGIRVFLGIYLLSAGGWVLAVFYPVFAVTRFHLEARDSALFTAMAMVGQMLGSVIAGVIGDRFGYAKVSVTATIALTVGLAAAIFGGGVVWYYVTAFALGVFLVSDRLALYNLAMAFSPHEDNTAYLGVVPALAAVPLALAAAACGPAIDRWGFTPVAVAAMAAAACSAYLAIARLPEPRYSLAGRRRPA